jgi:hypothetical protein
MERYVYRRLRDFGQRLWLPVIRYGVTSGVSPTIEKIQAVGGDYTTPQAWYDAHKGNLTSDPNAPYIGEMAAEEFPGVDMSGSTTDADHYFHLRAQSGAEFNGDFGGSYPLINTKATSDAFVRVGDDYTRLEHFVVGEVSGITEQYTYGIHANGADGVTIDTIGAYDITAVSAFEPCYMSAVFVDGGEAVIRNCAAGKLHLTATALFGGAFLNTFSSQNSTARFFNNAVEGCTAVGGVAGAGIVRGFFSSSDDWIEIVNNVAGTITGTSSQHEHGILVAGATYSDLQYNATTDTTGGSNSQDNITPAAEFADITPATLDLHMRAGGDCEDNGLDLLTAAYSGAPTEDCDNEARPDPGTWSIGIDHLVGLIYPEYFAPLNAILDERTHQRRPKHVRSITAVLSKTEKEPVEFVEGYNMNLAQSDEIVVGNRVKHQITFDVGSGNGAGIYPGCQPRPLVITTINDLAPTAGGDFYMTATGCYWARRQIDTTVVGGRRIGIAVPGLLQVGNDCEACCKCEQFVATGKYMNRVRDQYNTLGEDAERTRDQYHVNRDRWNVGKCCFDQHLLRLQMQPQLCPHIDVLGQFCNWTAECVGPLQMLFDLSGTDAVTVGSSASATPTAFPVPNFTHCYGNLRTPFRRRPKVTRCEISGWWPNYSYTFTEIEPYQHAWVRFRLFFENCGVDDSADPFLVSCCLRANLDGSPLEVPCGAEDLGSLGSSVSGSSISVDSDAWTGIEICKEEELQCPPQINDLYNPAKCFTRGQIFSAINP